MQNVPKISVLMSIYNPKEEYLREAIESILNQTYTDFEFLILDDGSTNNSAEIVKSYRDNRIRYFYHENEGLAATLNWGLDLVKGELIARMDADDISHPERFAEQVKFLEQNPDVSVIGTCYERFPETEIIMHPEKIDFLTLLKGCYIAHPSVMWRKNDFERYNLRYNKNFLSAQDYELWSRVVRYLKMQNLQKVLLKYRVHDNAISQKKSQLQQNNAKIVQKNMLDFLTNDTDLQQKIRSLFDFSLTVKKTVKLFSIIPIFLIKKNSKTEKWYLFGFIPFLKIRTKK